MDEKTINCYLCEKPIANYTSPSHHLRIDEHHEFYICSECIDKFVKWQRGILAKLFPTKAAKKRFGNR